MTETVLRTVFIEVEGILNAKPLGYVSSDVSDLDPVTPSILLMGRHDSSLPQVLYDSSNLLAPEDGNIAKYLLTISGLDSSITISRICKKDRNGVKMEEKLV